MALFAVRLDDCPAVNKWYSETVERGKQDSLIKNPIKWRWKRFKKGRSVLLVCDASPAYFNFSIFGWITAVGILLIWGMNWAVWVFLAMGMLGYFWTSTFFYHMTWLALRKKMHYKGLLKRVRLRNVVQEVVL